MGKEIYNIINDMELVMSNSGYIFNCQAFRRMF